MSSDIYSKPDLSHKVRYTRKAEEDRAEWQQREVCIYESADDIDYAVSEPQEEGQQIQNQPVVNKRCVRRSTLCKGVLSVLVLAGLIILCIYFTVEFNKLYYSHSLKELKELLVNNSQLQTSYNQLKNRTEVTNLKLESSYEILSKNYSLLKDEVKQLKDKLEGKWCPEGWTRFGCSCYFRSTETTSWSDSRKYCQDKGADLVIIDSKEEQKFVAELSHNGDSWIGLKGTRAAPGHYVWKWVDGSPLTKTYWESGSGSYNWDYATCCSPQGKWKHSFNSHHKNWICEK